MPSDLIRRYLKLMILATIGTVATSTRLVGNATIFVTHGYHL